MEILSFVLDLSPLKQSAVWGMGAMWFGLIVGGKRGWMMANVGAVIVIVTQVVRLF